jgi:hypothetical protein
MHACTACLSIGGTLRCNVTAYRLVRDIQHVTSAEQRCVDCSDHIGASRTETDAANDASCSQNIHEAKGASAAVAVSGVLSCHDSTA